MRASIAGSERVMLAGLASGAGPSPRIESGCEAAGADDGGAAIAESGAAISNATIADNPGALAAL